MGIKSIEDAKTLKAYCKKLEREGMGDRILEIAKKIVSLGEAGDYVTLMREAGKIKAVTTGASVDTYFGEKVWHGFHDELYKAEYENNK